MQHLLIPMKSLGYNLAEEGSKLGQIHRGQNKHNEKSKATETDGVAGSRTSQTDGPDQACW